MKVAITGASGYAGSLLAREHAARGDIVHALARNTAAVPAAPGIELFTGDVRRAAALPDTFFDADVFYHCAAEIADESLMQAVNVDATRALLDRARGRVRRWVQLGSLSVYGTPRAGVIDEESPVEPRSVYARSKLEADALVMAASWPGYTWTVLRPAAVIGPHMRSGSMRALIRAVASGRFRFIGAPGALSNCVHEADMIDALVLCATRSAAARRVYNLARNVPYERLVEAIAAANGFEAPRARIPESVARAVAHVGALLPGFPLTAARVDALTSRVEYRSDRIERELGFRHRRTIEDALRALSAPERATVA